MFVLLLHDTNLSLFVHLSQGYPRLGRYSAVAAPVTRYSPTAAFETGSADGTAVTYTYWSSYTYLPTAHAIGRRATTEVPIVWATLKVAAGLDERVGTHCAGAGCQPGGSDEGCGRRERHESEHSRRSRTATSTHSIIYGAQ